MRTVTQAIEDLIMRDLDRIIREIELYPTDESLWLLANDITNPAGNLCLHICGNLRHFIGATIGNDGYIRNRDAEFATKDITKEDLILEVMQAKMAVSGVLEQLPAAKLTEEYPIDVFGDKMSYQYFLIHLAGHLNYHLGQINYHRRLLA